MLSGKKILYVEDEALIRMVFSHTFEEAGMNVVEAGDVPIALRAFKACAPFDCIMTDLNLGKKSGLDLIRHIREENPYVPILVASGSPDLWAKMKTDQAQLLDGIEFLAKPFTDEVLLSKISALLQVPTKPPSNSADIPLAIPVL